MSGPAPFVEWLLLTQPGNVWIGPILAGIALTGVLLTSGLVCHSLRTGTLVGHSSGAVDG